MLQPFKDEYLNFTIYDAMRGVKLPSIKRSLTEDERHILAKAIFDQFKLSKLAVLCNPSPAHGE